MRKELYGQVRLPTGATSGTGIGLASLLGASKRLAFEGLIRSITLVYAIASVIARPPNNATLGVGLVETLETLANITSAGSVTPDQKTRELAQHLIPESNIFSREEVPQDMEANRYFIVFLEERI